MVEKARPPKEPLKPSRPPGPLLRGIAEATSLLLSRGCGADTLYEALAVLGTAAGADRSYLFEFHPHPETEHVVCSQRHEWAAASVEPQIDNPELQNAALPARWDAAFRAGRPIRGPVAQFPEDERRILEPQGVVSLLAVPVVVDSQVWGFIGFDDCHSERVWTDLEVSALATVASGVGGAVKRAAVEAALRDSDQRLRMVLESVPVLVYSAEAMTNRVLLLAGNVREILGYSTEALIAEPNLGSRAIHPDDQQMVGQAFAEGLARPEPFHLVYRVIHGEDGRTVWIHTHVRPVFDEKGRLLRQDAVVVDITRLKEAEARHEEIQGRLLEAQKLESLGVLAGGVAHDFNNLLSGIMGNAYLLQESLDRTNPLRDDVDEIIEAGRRASALTRQLLAYAGRASFDVRTINLSQYVSEIGHLLRSSVSRKVELHFDLSQSLPAVRADATQIQQLVMNLVLNAGEACQERPGTVRVRTGVRRIDLDRPPADLVLGPPAAGEYAFLEVRDTGVGMDAATLKRAFDPFFTTKSAGHGLGLSAVFGIVRGHAGAIAVTTRPGEGTTFAVYLPVRGGQPASEREEEFEDLFGRGTVLIAEDEGLVRRMATRSLQCYGYEVLTAKDGYDAVSVFRQHYHRIALVLLDLTMPELDGVEALAELRHVSPGVKVVLTSGYSQADAARRFAGAQPDGFLQKPYSVRQLAAEVKRVIETSGVVS